MDSADKATNKAMSAAYKYMAFMLFCIPVDGVEDADSETPPPPVRRPPPKAAPARPPVNDPPPDKGRQAVTEPPASPAGPALPMYEVLEVALDDIGTAVTHGRLAAIADALRRSPLSELEKETARDAWSVRSKFLGKAV